MITLRDRCLALPYLDRVSLCEELRSSIERETETGTQTKTNRGQELLGMMEEIMGEPIPLKSRKADYVWARTMVAYQLTREGITTTEAGRMLGKDHSTITFLKEKMEAALTYSYAYKDVVDIWKQFQKRIQDETDKRTD